MSNCSPKSKSAYKPGATRKPDKFLETSERLEQSFKDIDQRLLNTRDHWKQVTVLLRQGRLLEAKAAMQDCREMHRQLERAMHDAILDMRNCARNFDPTNEERIKRIDFRFRQSIQRHQEQHITLNEIERIMGDLCGSSI